MFLVDIQKDLRRPSLYLCCEAHRSYRSLLGESQSSGNFVVKSLSPVRSCLGLFPLLCPRFVLPDFLIFEYVVGVSVGRVLGLVRLMGYLKTTLGFIFL